MTEQYTVVIDGKRQWSQSYITKVELSVMFNRYRGEMNGHQSMDLYHKFVEIFEKELGLKIQNITPQKCSLMGWTAYQGFLVGEQVYIIPSITNKWVVKNGSFEQVVENMKDIFEIIRKAWRMR